MGMFNCKNVLSQSDCRTSQKYLKNNWRYKVGILHAGTYPLKLQIDDVVLSGCGQVCPGMLKEAIKT